MRETHIYCDACGEELTDGYPGETYTVVPVKVAVQRHHEPSIEEVREYHLCADEVEPTEFRSGHFFRAGDEIPMMLRGGMNYEYCTRADFDDRAEEVAEVLEDAWG